MARLRREFNLFTATVFGISVIVGAGIYSLIGAATAIAGSGVWLSFAIAALVASFTGLSYAELASLYPTAGSSFLYVFKGLRNRMLGFITGWLILFEAMVGAAAISIAFSNYFITLIPLPVMAVSFGIIALFSIINLTGIKESIALNNVMFVMEICGMLFVIAAGFMLGNAHPDLMDFQLPSVLSGAALVFFAMLGFEMIAAESEEAKDSKHTIPYAILISIAVCAVLYALFSIASLLLVGPEALGASAAPVYDLVLSLLGEYAFIFSIIALAATGSTILICLVTASRLAYGMAKGGSLPRFLTPVNSRFCTPHMAVLASFTVAVLFLLLPNIVIIAEVTNFAALAAFFLINMGLIGARMHDPDGKRIFRVPFSAPEFRLFGFHIRGIPIPAVLGALSSLFLITYLSPQSIAYGIGLIIAGIVVHLLHKDGIHHVQA